MIDVLGLRDLCMLYGAGVLELGCIGVLFYDDYDISFFHFFFPLNFLVLIFFYSALDISIDQLQEFGKVFVTIRLGYSPSQYERVAKPLITICNIAIYSDKGKQVEVHVIKINHLRK